VGSRGRLHKVMHVSDLHFGTETPAVCVALRALIDEQDPGALIVSGDLTQRAKPSEFEAAAQFLHDAAQGRALLAVPGNHDLPLFRFVERAAAPYRLFSRHFGSAGRVQCHDLGAFRLVLIDTTRVFRHKRGTSDEEQVAHVEAALTSAPHKAVCAVVCHHPLPAFSDQGERFRGAFASELMAETAVERWAQAGLDLVFCGHTHHARVLRLTSAHAHTHTPWLIQAGTSLSRRQRNEPNSLFVVSTDHELEPSLELALRPRLLCERWDFSINTQRFERVQQVLLN
jgi:3',5'-cyclic AMP phosphodiesterase CpdA